MSSPYGIQTFPADPCLLYVSPPRARTRGALRCLLLQSGLRFCDPSDGMLAVEVTTTGLASLGELLLRSLSKTDLVDCRAILVEKGAAYGPEMLPRMQPLLALISPTPWPATARVGNPRSVPPYNPVRTSASREVER